MLVANLPRDSVTRRQIIGEADDWGRVEYLLAEVIDAVQVWGWMNVGSKTLPAPKPVQRPEDLRRARGAASPVEQYERLQAQLQRR